MIARLSGTVVHKETRFAIIDVSGVGYKVSMTEETLTGLREDAEVTLFTYLAVREDALDLYGFKDFATKSFFELLISISGIGPKTALGVLNVTTLPALRRAVTSQDTSHLTKVSGIGNKLAQKIVLELKGKFEAEDAESGTTLREEVDALEALKSLGYSQSEAREALKKVEAIHTRTSDRVKAALKILGK